MAIRKRVFSGVQPSGQIHIGNYLGAIKHWVEDLPEYENVFCVVDQHAITVSHDPEILKAKIREVAALYLAAGIDPEQAMIFVQSQVPAHAELTWILNCIIPMGWLVRMTQFKEKSVAQKEHVSVGLFDYPALMAADILLYQTHYVPVGEDQRQHIELTREVARRFNSLFGETFRIPEPLIRERGARIMGLDDPTRKMSKSDLGRYHSIALLDSPDAIRKKIARAVTDSHREIRFDPERPGIYNLLMIYEGFSGQSRGEIEGNFRDKGYAAFKRTLAELIIESLRPLQERYQELSRDSCYVERVLGQGADKARRIAQKTLEAVKAKVGLG